MSSETSTQGGGQAPAPKRKSRVGWIVAGTIGLAVVGAGAVHAQRGPGFGWGGRDGGPHAGPRGGMRMERMARFERFCQNDTARYEPAARLFIKADLKLTKDQEAAFDKLADTALPAMNDLKKEACTNIPAMQDANSPEKLQHLAAVLRKAADAAEKSVQPMNDFYAKLDDAQKARVEQVLNHRRGMARMMMGPFAGMETGWRGHHGRMERHWGGRMERMGDRMDERMDDGPSGMPGGPGMMPPPPPRP